MRCPNARAFQYRITEKGRDTLARLTLGRESTAQITAPDAESGPAL